VPAHLDLSQDAPESVLVVVAHPDDIDFGTAGTVASLTDVGSRVSYCLATSGEAGAPEDRPRDEVRELRESEQTAAAAAVGVSAGDVHFLGFPDGHLEPTLELRREISRLIRSVRPDVVIAMSPERSWDSVYRSHPDHLAVAEATMAAVYPDSRNPHAHVDLLAGGYEPHSVTEVWVQSLDPLDVFIDITSVFERKVAALGSHASQLAHGRFEINQMLRDWATRTTDTHGLPAGRLTEAFRRVPSV
jgi:LmbE family N-acetylglucosaminyl deacetylase